MQIMVPEVPGALRITQGMWEDFLCDPVLAASVIFGTTLDAFQAARLRYYWWVQNVIDSSGVSSGKTVVIWLFLNLRAILLPDQDGAIFYPSFGTLKNTFWEYYSKCRSELFRAQLGRPQMERNAELGSDGTLHGADCYTAVFRNGNKIKGPAPSFMQDSVTQNSLRVNTMVIEEWTHVDAGSDGINKVLIDRTTRPCWNQYHPIWGNHILYSAHAQTLLHASAKRYKDHQRKVAGGDSQHANIAYSYKDYSGLECHTGKSYRDEYRIESTINTKRNTCGVTEWRGQGFGIWGASGTGWFSEELVTRARKLGAEGGLRPVLSRREWEGSYGL